MQMEQYEINWKNYYNILELSPTANDREITRAYRHLAYKYHPDRSEDSLVSDTMAEINEAYEVLSDLDRKAKYDEMFMLACGRQHTLDGDLEAQLTKAVITKLARERYKYRWMKRSLISIPVNILERLFDPIPTHMLFFAWLLYLLICITLLLSRLNTIHA